MLIIEGQNNFINELIFVILFFARNSLINVCTKLNAQKLVVEGWELKDSKFRIQIIIRVVHSVHFFHLQIASFPQPQDFLVKLDIDIITCSMGTFCWFLFFDFFFFLLPVLNTCLLLVCSFLPIFSHEKSNHWKFDNFVRTSFYYLFNYRYHFLYFKNQWFQFTDNMICQLN